MNQIHRCVRCRPKNVSFIRNLASDSDTNPNPPTKWRKTFAEKGEWTSKFGLFSLRNGEEGSIVRFFRRVDLRPNAIKLWWENIKLQQDVNTQRYLSERHDILGNDLATAHFILYRGGKVKFHHETKWHYGKEHNLPDKFNSSYRLEAVDASNVPLYYEGLFNFVGLKELKWLSFGNSPHIDDWCLDYISGELQTLEYLDIQNCQKVTEKGLACLYRLRKLKYLDVSNVCKTKEFEFTCLLLEDAISDLKIQGVKYLVE